MYTPKIALTKHEIEVIKKTIENLLGKSVQIILFGSRVNGTARKFSDVDIAVSQETKIHTEKLNQTKEKLSQKLPYLVDLIDLKSISKEFREVVEREGIKI